MTATTTRKAPQNGQATTKPAEPQQNNHDPKTNPLLTNQAPPPQATVAAPEPRWKAEVKRLDEEAKFWKKKYIEQMMNHAQVMAALSQPFLQAEAMAQFSAGNPEVAAKLAELQAQQT
jgi:hypothetical protein